MLSMASEMGIMIIFALSYNMLLGQGGMLSFGHAVYFGLGGFFTIHAINFVNEGILPLPLEILPLIGGLGGLFFGIIFGYVSTRRAGTPFALISLGIGELVAACSLMLPSFFGGEEGISGDRMAEITLTPFGFGQLPAEGKGKGSNRPPLLIQSLVIRLVGPGSADHNQLGQLGLIDHLKRFHQASFSF